MNRLRQRIAGSTAVTTILTLIAGVGGACGAESGAATVQLVLKDGRVLEGRCAQAEIRFGAEPRHIPLRHLLSWQSAAPASAYEAARIKAGIAALQAPDRPAEHAAAEVAGDDLTRIGLPVISPLLAAQDEKDTDTREPALLYRLFSRILPGYADGKDRSLDLVRLDDGTALRGKLADEAFAITFADGKRVAISSNEVRRLAVRRKTAERLFELHSLHHATFVSYLDTGLETTADSTLIADASGFVRLSFDTDGWASDPDGIQVPIPGKRKFEHGFTFGAVLGRVGSAGPKWLAGKHVEKDWLGAGRLYFAVNDNEHWQNNIGSFRVHVRAKEVYDLGDPQ